MTQDKGKKERKEKNLYLAKIKESRYFFYKKERVRGEGLL